MTSGYVVTGYALIWAAVLWYAWRTNRRLARAERELQTGVNTEL